MLHMQQVKARSLFLNYSTFDLVRTKMHLYRELRGLVVHALLVFFPKYKSEGHRSDSLCYEMVFTYSLFDKDARLKQLVVYTPI